MAYYKCVQAIRVTHMAHYKCGQAISVTDKAHYECGQVIGVISGGFRGGRRGRSPPPLKSKTKKERKGEGGLPSLYEAYQHSLIRLLNVINHYIFLIVALPF